MRADTLGALAALGPLDPAHARATSIPCKVCGAPAPFFDVVDFNKTAGGYRFGASGIAVQWFRCEDCGFLFTPFFDDWRAEDFRRFVYNADYALVDPDYRGKRPRRFLDYLVRLLGPPRGVRILDYGAGAGLVVEGLRALGHAARGYDPFSAPERPEGQFDLVLCCEVIEHAPQPLDLLRDARGFLAPGGTILLGQTLQPDDIGRLRGSWWYCAPRNGHCSTFTVAALLAAAEDIGLAFHAGTTMHAFTDPAGGALADRLAGTIGPALLPVTLAAPAEAQADGWHGIERSAEGPFRWTAGAAVRWPVTLARTGALYIGLPVRNEVRPGFLADCRFRVEDRDVSTRVEGGRLVAQTEQVHPAGSLLTVALHTLEPQSPRALRGVADDRRLGLAIPVARGR